MTYEESFLSTCDAEGKAPSWAIKQIFEEHSSDLDEFIGLATPQEWDDGETILHYLSLIHI